MTRRTTFLLRCSLLSPALPVASQCRVQWSARCRTGEDQFAQNKSHSDQTKTFGRSWEAEQTERPGEQFLLTGYTTALWYEQLWGIQFNLHLCNRKFFWAAGGNTLSHRCSRKKPWQSCSTEDFSPNNDNLPFQRSITSIELTSKCSAEQSEPSALSLLSGGDVGRGAKLDRVYWTTLIYKWHRFNITDDSLLGPTARVTVHQCWHGLQWEMYAV